MQKVVGLNGYLITIIAPGTKLEIKSMILDHIGNILTGLAAPIVNLKIIRMLSILPLKLIHWSM